jgi:hypothetical protein
MRQFLDRSHRRAPEGLQPRRGAFMLAAMMGDDVIARAEEVRGLLAEKLGARRRLPRALARDAAALGQAAELARNPKLARMIDPARTLGAHARLTAHLRAIDLGARRRTRLVNLTALLAFNLLVLFALVVGVLVWRGII